MPVMLVLSMAVTTAGSPAGADHSGAQATPSSRDIHFFAVADPQYFVDSSQPNAEGANRRADDTLDKIVEWTQGDPSVRGIVVAGDLTANSRHSELERYLRRIAPVADKVLDGIGNHDVDKPNRLCGRMDGVAEFFARDVNGFLAWLDGNPADDGCYDRRAVIEWVARDRPGMNLNHCGLEIKAEWMDHDFASEAGMETRNRDNYPCPHYSWDWDDVHFAQVNNYPWWDTRSSPGHVSMRGLAWLAQDLRWHVGTSGRPVVIIHHFDGSEGAPWWPDDQKDDYWDVIRNYNVVAILVGHKHPSAHQRWIEPFDRPSGRTSDAPYDHCTQPPCILSFVTGSAHGNIPDDNADDAYGTWYRRSPPGAFTDIRITGNTLKVWRWGVDGLRDDTDPPQDTHFPSTATHYFEVDFEPRRPYQAPTVVLEDASSKQPLDGLVTADAVSPAWSITSEYLPLSWAYRLSKKKDESTWEVLTSYGMGDPFRCVGWNGDPWTECAGPSEPIEVAEEGDYRLTLYGQDGLHRYGFPSPGGVMNHQDVEFAIDRTPPNITIDGIPDEPFTNAEIVSLGIIPEDKHLDYYEITRDGVTKRYHGEGGVALNFFAEGQHEVVVRAVDRARNAAMKTVSFTMDRTAPETVATVTPVPNALGWNNQPAVLHLQAGDALSGVAEIHVDRQGSSGSTVVVGDEIAIPLTDEGVHTFTYFAQDRAGNQEPARTIQVRIDMTPPTIVGSPDRAPNDRGWYASDVTVSFRCTDALSGIHACAPPTTLTDEGADQSVSGQAVDRAGNIGGPATVAGIHIDETAPTITASRTPPNDHGWNNEDVEVRFTCGDALSGVHACSPDAVVTDEGAAQQVQGTVEDLAGNTAEITVSDINIDKTAPTITCSASPDELWPPDHSLRDVSIAVDLQDGLSGPLGFLLEGATSDQPDELWGPTAGDIHEFAIGTADTLGQLRAERTMPNGARTYVLEYEGSDRADNSAGCAPTVRVPQNANTM